MSLKQKSLDPEDLIYGSKKLDGSRQFGYGTDVLRLWASTNDSDKNIIVDDKNLEKCNQDLKFVRNVAK